MIVFLSHADTDLLLLSHVTRALPEGFPPIRSANPRSLNTAAEMEAFLAASAPPDLVLLRLLGGKRSLEDALPPLRSYCATRGIPLILCSGESLPDPELAALSTAPPEIQHRTYEYLTQGGAFNLEQLLRYLSDSLLGTEWGFTPAAELPWDGVYHPDVDGDAEEILASRWRPDLPTIGILFYRAHWMSRNVAFVDALVRGLEGRANVLPVYCYSLKDDRAGSRGVAGVFDRYFTRDGRPIVDCLISTLSYSAAQLTEEGATMASGWSVDYLDKLDVPVLQAIACTSSREDWDASAMGLAPLDVAMSVAMPEFDGRLITVPVSFKQPVSTGGPGLGVTQYTPDEGRVDLVCRLAMRWAELRRKPNREKKLAILLTNYPSRNARIGNAVGLDTPASVIRLLHALRDDGYGVEAIPPDGDTLIHEIINRCSNDREFLTEEQMAGAIGRVSAAQYRNWWDEMPAPARTSMEEQWGAPPGDSFLYEGSLIMPGIQLGAITVGLQPPRGYGDNPIAVYHSPDLAPSHHYVAYYRWLRDIVGVDAIIHVGKHGTLEWLPGKGIGLSESCYPEVVLGDMPHFYPYIINNPGEGTQAKRRSHATIVDHLVPAMTTADVYDDIARLEQLLDEYYRTQTLDPAKLPILRRQVWEVICKARLDSDLGASDVPQDFDGFLQDVDGYLCELKDAQIRDGLHTLGQPPEGEMLVGLLGALLRLDNMALPGLRRALAESMDLNYGHLLDDRGARYEGAIPAAIREGETPITCCGDVVERLEIMARALLGDLVQGGGSDGVVPAVAARRLGVAAPGVESVLQYAADRLIPAIARTPDEIGSLLRGLRGGYVPAGPSGSPTRGMANILPTGRNFYSVDPRSIPSPAAWEVGQGVADSLIEKYQTEEGGYPETVGLVIWGTSAMRTHGDDIAEVLALLGVRPVWQAENRRVSGIEVIPIEELGRPRIDVTVRISGFFRDAFSDLVRLMDSAVQAVAALPETPEQNYVIKHLERDLRQEESPDRERCLYRIFGCKPGAYGAGILPAIDQRNWTTDEDLAAIYTAWGSYAYTGTRSGDPAVGEFRRRFREIVIAAKNQDNREHDIFDSDDYMQYHGGMIATVRALSGKNPLQYFGDTADPSRVKVRDLADEARRVFRTRVVNPRWLESIKRHGYKGAAELSATVDYLFGYDATAGIVEDWMYEQLTEAYVFNESMQEFFRRSNPWALRDITSRLTEAIDRGLWEHPSPEMRSRLEDTFLETETEIERRQEGSAP